MGFIVDGADRFFNGRVNVIFANRYDFNILRSREKSHKSNNLTGLRAADEPADYDPPGRKIL